MPNSFAGGGYPTHEPGQVYVETIDHDGDDFDIYMTYDELADQAALYSRLFYKLHADMKLMDRMTNFSPQKHCTPRPRRSSLPFYNLLIDGLREYQRTHPVSVSEQLLKR